MVTNTSIKSRVSPSGPSWKAVKVKGPAPTWKEGDSGPNFQKCHLKVCTLQERPSPREGVSLSRQPVQVVIV